MGCTIIGNVTDDDGCDNHEDAAADAALPTLCRTDAGKQLVFAEKRTAAVGTRIIGPEEDEDAQRQEHVIMYLTVECRSLECQNVNHREWQGNIHLWKHGVGPVVDGILVACVKLCNEEIHDGEQVGYEYHEVAHNACAETCHGKEEINACHGGDEAVHADVFLLVYQSAILPDAKSCNQGEQEYHRPWIQEARNHTGDEEYACNGSYH